MQPRAEPSYRGSALRFLPASPFAFGLRRCRESGTAAATAGSSAEIPAAEAHPPDGAGSDPVSAPVPDVLSGFSAGLVSGAAVPVVFAPGLISVAPSELPGLEGVTGRLLLGLPGSVRTLSVTRISTSEKVTVRSEAKKPQSIPTAL